MQVRKLRKPKENKHTTTLKNIPYTIVIGKHHRIAPGGSWCVRSGRGGGAGGGCPARAGRREAHRQVRGRCAYFVERVLFQGECFIQGGEGWGALTVSAGPGGWRGAHKGVSCKRCHCPLLRADLAKGFLCRSCVSLRVCFAHFPCPQ